VCGVIGWVSFGADLMEQRQVIDAMTATMACRGPDDSGTWVSPDAALGHCRLAVIDLAGGKQPMRADTPDGSVVLTYSGEVYNHNELRQELRAAGHRFLTSSDTEVVLRGYLQWGERVAERLNGMYAFGIWDQRDSRLVLIRDRIGVKPLYFYPTSDGVLFGSEPKAILANPMVPRVVDADGLRLAFTTIADAGSLWKGMREVEPATVLTVTRAGLSSRAYWRLSAAAHTDNREATVAEVRRLLDDTIRRQIVADVPLCGLLSGGLDSSTIDALAAGYLAERGERLRTFSVDYLGQEENFQASTDRPLPDAPFAREMASWIGSEHHSVVLDPGQLSDPEVRRAVLTSRDHPSGTGDMDTSMYLLFKNLREHSTVALSGEAADEYFGGYRWLQEALSYGQDTFPWLIGSPHGNREHLLTQDVRDALDIPGFIAEQFAAAVSEVDHLPGEAGAEARMRTMIHITVTRWLRQLLARKDRLSMAVGLEVRVPFCDHRLLEYVYQTPWSMKTFDGREKSLLRHAVTDIVPDSVRCRRKSPYPVTQDAGYIAALQIQVKDALLDRSSKAFLLADEKVLETAVQAAPENVDLVMRNDMDRFLDLYHWCDLYQPEITQR
jgi:asparagine synthase (glutamine-hydrolysing)